MNYIKQFAEMIGVELGEKFNIVDDETLKNSCPYVVLNGVGIVDSTGTTVNSSTYKNIIVGVYEIQKLPWKPKDGDRYYRVGVNGFIDHDEFDVDFSEDLDKFKMGNCFRSRQEAEKNKGKVVEMYRKIKEQIYEEKI